MPAADALFNDVDRHATISPDGLYRYDLARWWGDGPQLGFVMLNPSTGDANVDDATLRRCMGFARRDGFDGIVVRNLFAYRTPKPKVLLDAMRDGIDVVGPDNDEHLRELARPPTGAHADACRIVLAWGVERAVIRSRIDRVIRMLEPAAHLLVRFADDRHPNLRAPHPLMLPTECPLVPGVTVTPSS